MGLLNRLAALVSPPKVEVIRSDGWINPTIGFGNDRDKMEAAYFQGDFLLGDMELSHIYYGEDIAATIVNEVIDESFRVGYCLEADDDETAEALQQWACDDDKAAILLDNQIMQAAKFGRVWGGALLILGINDGQDLDQPLNEKSIKDCEWTLVVDRRHAWPNSWYNRLGPKLGQPETYRVAMAGSSIAGTPQLQGKQVPQSWVVHESRCVRFDGELVDRLKALQLYQGWSLSVLQRPYKAMRAFGAAFQAAGIMLSDASQGVIKIENLISMLSGGNRKAILERMQMMDLSRSVSRSLVLDTKEDFTKQATSFAGISDVIDRFMNRLSAATKPQIPVSILMGRSAAGMNATGDLDQKSWAKGVAAYQCKTIGPKVLRAYRLLSLCRNAPTKGKELTGLCVKWHNLLPLNDLEMAQVRKTTADTDAIYMTASVVDPAAVAIKRFGGDEWDLGPIEVDVTALEKELTSREIFTTPATTQPSDAPATDIPVDPKTGLPMDPPKNVPPNG